MALSTGRNEISLSVIRHHFQLGLEELVNVAQCLIEARTDMKRHVVRASQEMAEALKELQGILSSIDTESVQMIAQRQSLEGKRQAQAEKLRSLRHQIEVLNSVGRMAQGMLETAQKHLKEMRQKVSQMEAEVQHNEQIRNIGIGLMFIPVWGMIAGSIMVGCSQGDLDAAQKTKEEAEAEVDRRSAEVEGYLAEINRCRAQIREAEAQIWTNEKELSSTEKEKQQLASQQAELVTLQNTLRKSLTFLNILSGKVDSAELLIRDVVIYHELEWVLEDIVNHVLPLMGQGNQTNEIVLSSSEIRGLIGRLNFATERLSLEMPRSGNVAKDF